MVLTTSGFMRRARTHGLTQQNHRTHHSRNRTGLVCGLSPPMSLLPSGQRHCGVVLKPCSTRCPIAASKYATRFARLILALTKPGLRSGEGPEDQEEPNQYQRFPRRCCEGRRCCTSSCYILILLEALDNNPSAMFWVSLGSALDRAFRDSAKGAPPLLWSTCFSFRI